MQTTLTAEQQLRADLVTLFAPLAPASCIQTAAAAYDFIMDGRAAPPRLEIIGPASAPVAEPEPEPEPEMVKPKAVDASLTDALFHELETLVGSGDTNPTNARLAKACGVSIDVISRGLNALEAAGRIRRHGQRRSRTFEIIRSTVPAPADGPVDDAIDEAAPVEVEPKPEPEPEPEPTQIEADADADEASVLPVDPDEEERKKVEWLEANGGPSTEPNLGPHKDMVLWLRSQAVDVARVHPDHRGGRVQWTYWGRHIDTKELYRLGNRARNAVGLRPIMMPDDPS